MSDSIVSNPIVTDTPTLRALCERLRSAPWIALDTEFLRVQTYRARLCLIQVATPDEIACIDPLAALDLTPLLELLYAPAPLKVLHAARQDLEVFADLRGTPPAPVFDTQIAAALVGDDEQIGYAGLVEKITGHKLAKVEARTDWSLRPLSEAQVRYAEDDVRYLRDVYATLVTRLAELGRSQWLAEECAALTEPALYRNDPAEAWRRLGGGATLSAAQQPLLAALATWREHQAQQRDLPRSWVVPDVALVEIARQRPSTAEALATLPDIKPSAIRRDGAALLDIVARPLPPQTLWDAPDRLDPQQMDTLKRLTTLARERARVLGLSPALLASRRELMRLLRGDPGCLLLRGWRRAAAGEALLAALAGRAHGS